MKIKDQRSLSDLSSLLEDLVIANIYDLKECLAVFMEQKPDFKTGNSVNKQNLNAYFSSQLPGTIKYELVKNTITTIFDDIASARARRPGLDCIFNFLDLIFYDNMVKDLSPKQKSVDILRTSKSLFHYDSKAVIQWITCVKDCGEDCVTLVVEDQEIHIGFF